MDVNAIKSRIHQGQKLNAKEVAHLIKNDANAFAAFMVENNPGNVNFTLRRIGYSHLGFEPNAQALARQLDLFIKNNNKADWAEVVKNFKVDRSKIPAEVLKELNEKTVS